MQSPDFLVEVNYKHRDGELQRAGQLQKSGSRRWAPPSSATSTHRMTRRGLRWTGLEAGRLGRQSSTEIAKALGLADVRAFDLVIAELTTDVVNLAGR